MSDGDSVGPDPTLPVISKNLDFDLFNPDLAR